MVVGVTNHKLVNTTPKPSATKNSKGELGPPCPCPAPLPVGEGDAVGEIVELLDVAADIL